ncbi:MAG: phytanoyl-CoA dioxygenase family protein [Halothiobacillus sp.]|jgi:ectoine hydroxylase-related dioxygenase (phytanoyl-CoA dioxygenase family)|nr:phytanoyl-CoA dioxygenase family protein [Halothiobacillus sp.]
MMHLDVDGVAVIERLLSVHDTELLCASLDTHALAPKRGGIRRIEQRVPEVNALAQGLPLMRVAQSHLVAPPQLVRAIYFDKSPGNNWLVTWHQDRTVAVSDRFDLVGWGPWSLKAGAWHVQPPIDVLEQMVTIRVHLDAATRANGCLKIVRGSHHLGLIETDRVRAHVDPARVVYCEAGAGSVVVMRPHVLHASEKSVTPARRRVLHFEFSDYPLPDGIGWAT